MQLLTHHIIHGWPATKQHLPNQRQVFWHFREELSIADDHVLKSTRVIVPLSLRAIMLEKIHQSHSGPEYCLRFARDAVFWHGMASQCYLSLYRHVRGSLYHKIYSSSSTTITSTNFRHVLANNIIETTRLFTRSYRYLR